MKFKQQEQKEEEVNLPISKELYDAFADLIQLEHDKLGLLRSGKYYFYENGISNCEKFFAHIYNKCLETVECLKTFLMNNYNSVPSFKDPEIKPDFSDNIEPFKQLAEKEDEYVENLSKLIDIAFDNKNWIAVAYLLEKINKFKPICSRALSAVENKSNVLDLICEQHSTAK